MNRKQRRQAARLGRQANPASDDIQQQLGRARQRHRHGDLGAAEQAYRQILARQPEHADALHLLGVLQHQRGHGKAAMQLIRRAIAQQPTQPSYHYNLGEIQRAEQQYSQAVASYRQSLALNDAQPDAHYNLGNALQALGQHAEAVDAYRRALGFIPADAELHNNLANALADIDLPDEALQHYAEALRLDPDYAEAYYNRGDLLRQQGRFEAALPALRQAIERAPDWAAAQLALGRTLHVQQRPADALTAYHQAAVLQPDLPDALDGAGQCLSQLGRYEEAEQHFRTLIEQQPRAALGHYRLGCCLESQGHFEAAIRSHLAAIDLDNGFSAAYYQLSRIKHFHADAAHLRQLEQLLTQDDLDDDARLQLHFALAGHLRGADAFDHYRAANALKSRQQPFNAPGHADYLQRLIDTFDPAFFARHHGHGDNSELPVFIVGMPRSGSTLVEQILASHPQVLGAGELDDVRALVRQLPAALGSERPFPECAELLSPPLASELAAGYLNARRQQAPKATRVCDKMLGNYVRLGLIALLFPRARIIHCQRDPLDTCLSCYFQHFEHGLRFSYDLRHLGLAYRAYQRLMQHWREVLPLPMLEVQYEDLVADQATISRQLVDFCGLDWDARCLQFHQHQRGIHTASAWQVRQPLYASSVGRWREFEHQLQPLIEALAED